MKRVPFDSPAQWRSAPVVAALMLLTVRGGAQQTRIGAIEPYLMSRAEEIALARSAGPNDIGAAATILVLTSTGYVTAAEGSNGFTCFVGRGWSGPRFIDKQGVRVVNPDVTNRGLRAPHCFNRNASASVVPWHLLMTNELIGGRAVEELEEATFRALHAGKLQIPGPQAMAYMTSSRQHLGERVRSWHPHVMLYVPYATNEAWGSPGFSARFPFVTEARSPWAVVVIPLSTFSDGTTPAVTGQTGQN